MPGDGGPSVGLVLVTYGSADDLPPFLESLPAATTSLALDVVAVDNASPDGTVELLEAAGVRVLANRRNVGLTAAINQGARELDTEWLLVANPDTRLMPGAISQLVTTAAADPRVGLIGPRVAELDGTPYPTGRRFPSVGVGIAHALLARLWPTNPATRAYFGDADTANETEGGVRDVDWVSGCCLLFLRAGFDAAGGFDERYLM